MSAESVETGDGRVMLVDVFGLSLVSRLND